MNIIMQGFAVDNADAPCSPQHSETLHSKLQNKTLFEITPPDHTMCNR